MWGRVRESLPGKKDPRDDDVWEVKVATAKYHLENAISALVDVQGERARNMQLDNARRAQEEMDKAIAGYMKFSPYKGNEAVYNEEYRKLCGQLKGAEEISAMKVRALREQKVAQEGDARREALYAGTRGAPNGYSNNGAPYQQQQPQQPLPVDRMAPSHTAPPHLPYGGLDRYTADNSPYGQKQATFQNPSYTPDGILTQAIEIQQDGTRSLHRSAALTEKSNNLAGDIAHDLKLQSEQMEHISEDLHLLEKQVKMARREVYSFARDRSRDKCFVCIFILMMLLLLGAFLLKMFNPMSVGDNNTDSGLSNATIAPTPVPTPVPTP